MDANFINSYKRSATHELEEPQPFGSKPRTNESPTATTFNKKNVDFHTPIQVTSDYNYRNVRTLEQEGDLDASFEEPVGSTIKEKEKAAKGKKQNKRKGCNKSKGKQEVGQKQAKQQSHTITNHHTRNPTNDLNVVKGIKEQDEDLGGALTMMAKKRLTSACETANRTEQLNDTMPAYRSRINMPGLLNLSADPKAKKIYQGGNGNVVVRRRFPGSRPQSTNMHATRLNRQAALASSYQAAQEVGEEFLLSSPQSFMNKNRSRETVRFPKQGKTQLLSQTQKLTSAATNIHFTTKHKHLLKHQSVMQRSLGSGFGSQNYSPFDISSAVVIRADGQSLLNINENNTHTTLTQTLVRGSTKESNPINSTSPRNYKIATYLNKASRPNRKIKIINEESQKSFNLQINRESVSLEKLRMKQTNAATPAKKERSNHEMTAHSDYNSQGTHDQSINSKKSRRIKESTFGTDRFKTLGNRGLHGVRDGLEFLSTAFEMEMVKPTKGPKSKFLTQRKEVFEFEDDKPFRTLYQQSRNSDTVAEIVKNKKLNLSESQSNQYCDPIRDEKQPLPSAVPNPPQLSIRIKSDFKKRIQAIIQQSHEQKEIKTVVAKEEVMPNEYGFRSVFAKGALRDGQPRFKGSLREVTSQVLGRADQFCELKKQQSRFREKHGLPKQDEEEHGHPTKIDELYGALAQDCLLKDDIDELIIKFKEPEEDAEDDNTATGVSLAQATILLNELVQMKLQDREQSSITRAQSTKGLAASGPSFESAKSSKDAENIKKEQYDLFRLVFNQVCCLIYNGNMNSNIYKIETLNVNKFAIQRFQGTYCQISTKSKPLPCYISVTHDDVSAIGVQIFWSRKNKYPCQDDNEGVFNAVFEPASHDSRLQQYYYQLVPPGEKPQQPFTTDNLHFGVYQYSTHANIQLEMIISFGTKSSWSALQKRYRQIRDADEERLRERADRSRFKSKSMSTVQGRAAQDEADEEVLEMAHNENNGSMPISTAQFMKECKLKIEAMVGDSKKREEQEVKVQKIRADQVQERSRKDAEAEARRRELLAMESIRNTLKPKGMTSQEYRAQCVAERKAEIDRQYLQLKLALSLKCMYITHTRHHEGEHGRELNFHRIRVWLFIMFMTLKNVFNKVNERFLIKQKEKDFEKAKNVIVMIIKERYLDKVKRRGDPARRSCCAIKQDLTFCHLMLGPPIEERCQRVFLGYLRIGMRQFNILTGIKNYLRRVKCIQKAFKEKRQHDQQRLGDLTGWMDQGIAVLRNLFLLKDKQNKKLREKFPNFVQQLYDLTADFKQAAAHQHAAFAKYIHILKLLRWSGDHLHGGQYNVDACISLSPKLVEYHAEMTRQQDLFKDKYPTAEQLKKSYKKALVVKEKKGKRDKNAEQPTESAEKVGNDHKKSESQTKLDDAEADKTLNSVRAGEKSGEKPKAGAGLQLKEESISQLELVEQETQSLTLNIVIGDTAGASLSRVQEKKKKDLTAKTFCSTIETAGLEQRPGEMQKSSNTISQKEYQCSQQVDVNMMKSFHEAIDLPYEEVCDAGRPELKHEIDIGDGAGGLWTIQHLIYSALLLQEEAALLRQEQLKEQLKQQQEKEEAYRKKNKGLKDISELQKYEEQNSEYVDAAQMTQVQAAHDHIPWNQMAKFLPTSREDKPQIAARQRMWKNMDRNGDGQVQYKEAEDSLKEFFHGDTIMQARPAIRRAFDFAKDFIKDGKKGKKPHTHSQGHHPVNHQATHSAPKSNHALPQHQSTTHTIHKNLSDKDNCIEKREFRIFLVALRQRLEYFEGFSKVDVSGDGAVDKAEFLKSLESIERWAGKIENPSEEFDRMDADKQGTITFDEFCDWSIKRNLDLDDDGENCLAITQTPVESGVATPATEAAEK